MVKLGFLFLNNETWNGKEILSIDWIKRATQTIYYPFEGDDYYGYGYQWWIIPNLGIFCVRGTYGQYIFVSPEHDLIVGFNADFTSGPDPVNLFMERYILPALTTESSNEEATDNEDYILFFILIFVACTIPAVSVGIYLIRKIRRK